MPAPVTTGEPEPFERLDYLGMLRKYVAMARMEPDDRFTLREADYLWDLIHLPHRRAILREWAVDIRQPATRRIRVFLLNHRGAWGGVEIKEACRIPNYNTLRSALYRLHAQGLIGKRDHNQWEATSERRQASGTDPEVGIQAAEGGAAQAPRPPKAPRRERLGVPSRTARGGARQGSQP